MTISTMAEAGAHIYLPLNMPSSFKAWKPTGKIGLSEMSWIGRLVEQGFILMMTCILLDTVKLVYMYRVRSHPSPIHIGRYTVREGTALQCLRSL